MARSAKKLLGHWLTEERDRIWVYKAGRGYSISHGDSEHSCHASIRSLRDTKKEAVHVFLVNPTDFHAAG